MDDVLTENISTEEIQEFENIYNDELKKEKVTSKAKFEYAWCLVRSKYRADIKKGILLLEELYRTEEEGQRDYLYFIAIGNARIKEYSKALDYVNSFLSVEPGNQQVVQLETLIKKHMSKDGIRGMAIVGGIAVALGATVAVGTGLLAALAIRATKR